MLQVNHHKELSAQIKEWKRRDKSIAFVPTMGNLHDGHLSLLRLGLEQADKLVCSIFVNPMQFGDNEDLDSYPRTLEKDCKALMEHHCDLVYLPGAHDLYPQGMNQMTRIEVPGVTERLEGAFRPGHLIGVSTIVLKLFNLVQPDIAVFGKKDYQQLQMVRKMVKDLNLPITILAGETIRESDGLAMSSRNQYLNEKQRAQAVELHRQLQRMAARLREPGANRNTILTEANDALRKAGFDMDYLDVSHRNSLQPATVGDPGVILAAGRLGNTRLIDNLEI